MDIDDRLNYFMMGVTVSLISHYRNPIWYYLGLIATIAIIAFFISRFKLMGDGDVSTIAWLFTGLGLINYWLLVSYLIFFTVILMLEVALFYIIRHFFKANKAYFPAMPSFLIAFVLVIFAGGLV